MNYEICCPNCGAICELTEYDLDDLDGFGEACILCSECRYSFIINEYGEVIGTW